MKTIDKYSIEILSRWREGEPPTANNPHPVRDRFKFRIAISNGRGQVYATDYSGGYLAFCARGEIITKDMSLEDVSRIRKNNSIAIACNEARKSARVMVRTVYQDAQREGALETLLRLAVIKPENVIQSLILDMDAGSNRFDEFCSEMGYDEDSRKAYAIWEQCRNMGIEFSRFVGSDIDQLREETRDL